MKRCVDLMAIVLVGGLAACSSAPSSASNARGSALPTSAAELTKQTGVTSSNMPSGTKWVVVGVAKRPSAALTVVPRSLQQAWIEFIDDWHVSGTDGFEPFAARYRESGGELTISDVSGTLGGTSSRSRIPKITLLVGAGMRNVLGIYPSRQRVQAVTRFASRTLFLSNKGYALKFAARRTEAIPSQRPTPTTRR